MKHFIAAFACLLMVSLSAMAQDDLYFVPKKQTATTTTHGTANGKTHYSGSRRNVDEYNRQPFHFERIDTTAGNDIIEFDAVEGVYPDTIVMDEDYACTRQMSRFDDYEWQAAYNDGYRDGRTDRWLWSNSLYYDPFYYDLWFYDGYPHYYGDLWYYNTWGYPRYRSGLYLSWYSSSYLYRPYYYWSTPYHTTTYHSYSGVTGTRDRGNFRNNRSTTTSNNRNASSNRNRGAFSNSSSNRSTTTTQRSTTSPSNRSTTVSSSSRSGGGFSSGGARSGGGGSRSGGGNFGGRR